jgi:hypothetical protein
VGSWEETVGMVVDDKSDDGTINGRSLTHRSWYNEIGISFQQKQQHLTSLALCNRSKNIPKSKYEDYKLEGPMIRMR